jgi:hypothetical protein
LSLGAHRASPRKFDISTEQTSRIPQDAVFYIGGKQVNGYNGPNT